VSYKLQLWKTHCEQRSAFMLLFCTPFTRTKPAIGYNACLIHPTRSFFGNTKVLDFRYTLKCHAAELATAQTQLNPTRHIV